MGSRSKNLFISLSGELLVLGMLLLIPLTWTNRLPHFDSRAPLRIGPPPPARPAAVTASHSNVPRNRQPSVIFRSASIPRIGNPTSHVELEPPTDPPGINGGMETGATYALPPAISPIKLTPPAEKPKVDEPKPFRQGVRVSQGAQLAKLIHEVKPIYPTVAKTARISGTVQLLAVISKDGTVHNLQTLSGNPLLVRAALDAVSQWVYRPTLLNGEPVEVTAPIEVNFILTQ